MSAPRASAAFARTCSMLWSAGFASAWNLASTFKSGPVVRSAHSFSMCSGLRKAGASGSALTWRMSSVASSGWRFSFASATARSKAFLLTLEPSTATATCSVAPTRWWQYANDSSNESMACQERDPCCGPNSSLLHVLADAARASIFFVGVDSSFRAKNAFEKRISRALARPRGMLPALVRDRNEHRMTSTRSRSDPERR